MLNRGAPDRETVGIKKKLVFLPALPEVELDSEQTNLKVTVHLSGFPVPADEARP